MATANTILFYEEDWIVHDYHATHCKYTQCREDAMKIRYDYLDWVQTYRTEGHRIYYQDET